MNAMTPRTPRPQERGVRTISSEALLKERDVEVDEQSHEAAGCLQVNDEPFADEEVELALSDDFPLVPNGDGHLSAKWSSLQP
jgi:hypothetical protein